MRWHLKNRKRENLQMSSLTSTPKPHLLLLVPHRSRSKSTSRWLGHANPPQNDRCERETAEARQVPTRWEPQNACVWIGELLGSLVYRQTTFLNYCLQVVLSWYKTKMFNKFQVGFELEEDKAVSSQKAFDLDCYIVDRAPRCNFSGR